MTKRKIPPHPPAFKSPLWPHYEKVRFWRRKKVTWYLISEWLKKDYGISLTESAIQVWYKAATRRFARGRIPAGSMEQIPQPLKTKPLKGVHLYLGNLEPEPGEEEDIFSKFKPK